MYVAVLGRVGIIAVIFVYAKKEDIHSTIDIGVSFENKVRASQKCHASRHIWRSTNLNSKRNRYTTRTFVK